MCVTVAVNVMTRISIVSQIVLTQKQMILQENVLEMINYNTRSEFTFGDYYSYNNPLLLTEYEFDWVPNPNDISVAENMERLHQNCSDRFRS
jgi:hypothetical protein